MRFPSRETIANLREQYKKGMRVELVSMNDPYSKLMPGDKGTIDYVDDAGGIHIDWDCGSSLAAIWGEDTVNIITE